MQIDEFVPGMTVRELQGVIDIEFNEAYKDNDVGPIRDIWWNVKGECYALVKTLWGNYTVRQIHEIRQNSEVIWKEEEDNG